MWEYSISFDRNNFELAKKTSEKIKRKTTQLNGITTILVGSYFVDVLVAVPDIYKDEIREYIIDIIVNIYTTTYKFDYLMRNFNFEVTDDLNMKAFVKALMVFDLETDRKIVIQKVCNNDNRIVVESFFNFRLGILKTRWDDLVNLVNDNVMYLMSKDTFIEFIKFLVSNLDSKCDFVCIKEENGDFCICDKEGKEIKGESDDGEVVNEIFLITTLISLNPKKIRIDTKYNLRDGALSLLYELFNNRVEIFK